MRDGWLQEILASDCSILNAKINVSEKLSHQSYNQLITTIIIQQDDAVFNRD